MPKETIGPKIKNLRKKKKLTQEELAHSLGYSGRSVISHIEHGDADMTYEKILLLLKTYMLDANEFFEVESINKRIEDWKLEQRRKKKSSGVYPRLAWVFPGSRGLLLFSMRNTTSWVLLIQTVNRGN